MINRVTNTPGATPTPSSNKPTQVSWKGRVVKLIKAAYHSIAQLFFSKAPTTPAHLHRENAEKDLNHVLKQEYLNTLTAFDFYIDHFNDYGDVQALHTFLKQENEFVKSDPSTAALYEHAAKTVNTIVIFYKELKAPEKGAPERASFVNHCKKLIEITAKERSKFLPNTSHPAIRSRLDNLETNKN